MSEENKILTTREAMQALLDGKKITRDVWPPHEFLYLVGDMIVNQDDCEWDHDLNVSYQLYKEPKKKVKYYRVGFWYRGDKRPDETSTHYKSLDDFYENYCGNKEDYKQARLIMNTEQEYEVPE